MDWHTRFIRHLIAPLWARWEGSAYLHHYHLLRRSQYDPPETVAKHQWDKLKALLHHAYATVPFYRERWDYQGVSPDHLKSFADFHQVPLLSKADIRQHGDALRSSAYRHHALHHKQTSGSTGVALDVFVEEASLQFKRACTLRADEWSGWRFGEPAALVWGNPEYLQRGWRGRIRNAMLERHTYLDTLKIDNATLRQFTRALLRKRPTLIFGHAHSVYLLAQYLRTAGTTAIRPRGVITTAMVLHSWQREVIEEVFGCKVTNRYGCEEVSLIACECELHNGLHINADGIYLEIVHDGRPAQPGESGSIVLTDLTNRAMPLIRYQVGDRGAVSARRCPCGRGLPLLERVEGREADYVVTPRGEMVSGISLTENFALCVPGVAQFQIIQENVRNFRFRIVPSADFGSTSLQRLGELVRRRLGAGVNYTCEYLEQIPVEPSGKYRFCISKVIDPFARSGSQASL